MKHTNLIALLVVIILFVGLFAACGGEKPDETQPGVTLPTIEAPDGTGNGTAEPGEQTQSSQSGIQNDPFAETKKWEPNAGEKGGSEENPGGVGDPDNGKTPEETKNGASGSEDQPAPSQSGASLTDDSGEDVVVTESAPPDDTDEDLP